MLPAKVLQFGTIQIPNAVLLAPMEDVTNLPFRLICKAMGADIVYTEFASSDGLVRNAAKTLQKIRIDERERPVGIQIFGGDPETMRQAARIAEQFEPDFIDINCGCWVKNVVRRNAGAALLRDIPRMLRLVKTVIDSVRLPVTVKTRLGWDRHSIRIVEVAQQLEDIGVAALAIHCRTRDMGHQGTPLWEWIDCVKEKVSMPVILNGGITSWQTAAEAFWNTQCDAIMIGKAAIGNPFIFREVKHYLQTGQPPTPPSLEERIAVCLQHLELTLEFYGTERGIRIFRKYYSGYFKGLPRSAQLRQQLVTAASYEEVRTLLEHYLEQFHQHSPSLELATSSAE